MWRLATVCTALLLLVSSPRVLWAQACPQNSFFLAGFGYYEEYSTAPTWTWAGMSYDHVAGTLEAGHTGSGEVGSSGGVTARDRFRIVGPALGSPIPIQVRVHLSGSAGGGVVFLPNLGSGCLGSRVRLHLASGSALDEVQVESPYGTPCAGQSIDHTTPVPTARRSWGAIRQLYR